MKKTILYIFLATILFYVFLGIIGYRLPFPIPKEELLGKTKIEILDIIFEKSEIRAIDKYQIGIPHRSFYFDTKKEALQSKQLMESNSWECFFTRTLFKFNGETRFYEIEFKDGISKNVKISSYSEF